MYVRVSEASNLCDAKTTQRQVYKITKQVTDKAHSLTFGWPAGTIFCYRSDRRAVVC